MRAAACTAALVSCALPAAADQSGIIPLPASVVPAEGWFEVGSATTIVATDNDGAQAGRYLAELWKHSNGLAISTVTSVTAIAGRSVIVFQQAPGFGPEAYRLEVAPNRVTVSAGTSAGLFYGAVSLWQLLPAGPKSGRIEAQTIVDEPKYAWRGLMLDSSRHFQSPAFVRSTIDWMAWHKLNVLHWHLTDDQGWRLQIRRYPLLTSVGAWRIPASVPGAPAQTRYGGFYTQDQVRDIVAFAAARHVQIVPEIDMPGHATAAIAAYPALGTSTGSTPPILAVSPKWGVLTHLFNVEPSTFEFLENVLGEVMELFPSHYIHVGGDEAVKDEWNASQAVQARARELGIADSEALQTHFIQEIGRYLSSHGRRLVGWDEIVQPGLPSDAVVMSWRGVSGARTAARQGNDTVLAPQPTLYLDRRQSSLASEPPGRIQISSLEDVYRFEPADAQLSPEQLQHVLGVQANIWTEHIQTEARVQWMALPRAAALAEVGWSTSKRSWPDFLKRLQGMQGRYRAFGLGAADSAFGIDAHITRADDAISVALANLPELSRAGLDTRIRYTLDGREPTGVSPSYSGPLIAPVGTLIRAATFLGAQQVSRTWTMQLDAHSAVRRLSSQLELCNNNGVGLLLEPVERAGESKPDAPIAIDIMNPCWIYRGVDLQQGPNVVAAVAALPFNYELGADAAGIRVGDARTPDGELEVHLDSCDGAPAALLALAPAANRAGVTELPAQRLPPQSGRHDICLKFARPRLDPMWGLEWVEIGE
jgi:hexosaminidase